jgi:hypothetical protein
MDIPALIRKAVRDPRRFAASATVDPYSVSEDLLGPIKIACRSDRMILVDILRYVFISLDDKGAVVRMRSLFILDSLFWRLVISSFLSRQNSFYFHITA